eukprot:498550_1
MAEQKVENVVKSFENVQFEKLSDKYDIKLEFNSNLGNISLEFMNKSNIQTYNQTFTQKDINGITTRCQLSAENLSQVIIDQLSSSDFINKFCRIFLFSDSKQASTKIEEFSKMNCVPEATGIIEGDEGKLNEVNNNETKTQLCLLFVLHFNPSKYVRCNYCFMMKEKHLTDSDRFLIKFNEIKQENQQLKNELKQQNELITQLTKRLDKLELEQKRDDNDVKMEEIALELKNNWVNYGASWETAKACKIRNIVYMKGLVKGGQLNTVITTLPEGWRPAKYRIFGLAQNDGKAVRVNVQPNGSIYLNSAYISWISLDGIQFVIN